MLGNPRDTQPTWSAAEHEGLRLPRMSRCVGGEGQGHIVQNQILRFYASSLASDLLLECSLTLWLFNVGC